MKNTRKNIGKRLLSITLAILLTVTMMPKSLLERMNLGGEVHAATTLANPRMVTDSSMTSGQKVTWDCIWFGSYPQTEIVDKDSTSGVYGKNWTSVGDYEVDSNLYQKLENATGWDSKGDIILGSEKYRRLQKTDANYQSSGYAPYFNWPSSKTYHYFRYDDIKWRILGINGNEALIIADKVLDSQLYHESNTSVTWETSSIRAWLNNSFFNKAFDSNQRAVISSSYLINNKNISSGITSGNNTQDRLFFLSDEDVYTDNAVYYGFNKEYNVSDPSRMAYSSTYAKAMGISSTASYSSNSPLQGRCVWWLRTAGNSSKNAATVEADGKVSSGGRSVDSYFTFGVRPVLHLDLTSSLYTFAGTVCSDGSMEEEGKIDTKIHLEQSIEASTFEDISISAEVTSSSFEPTTSNMSWQVEYNNGEAGSIDDVRIDKMSIVKSGDNSYTISSVFNFRKSGNHKVTLKSDDGVSASSIVTVKGAPKLRIQKPASTNQAYAEDINSSKTFTMTLEKAEEIPSADDFTCTVRHRDDFTEGSSVAATVSSEGIKIKNIREEADGKYSLEFEFKPNDTGFFDFSLKYKDEDEDDVELMVYDTAILEKLEADYEGTIKKTYESYMKKIKKEMEKVEDEVTEATDYASLVEDLKKDSSLIINDGSIVGSLNPDKQNLPADNELLTCAYEAYARAMENTCADLQILFEKVDNDKAESNIVNSVIQYINNGQAISNRWVKLDSGCMINGKFHTISAKWNLNFKNGKIDLRDDRTNKQYTFSATSESINKCVANYLDALNKLEQSAIKNAVVQCLSDFEKLINWNISGDWEKFWDDANEKWANDLAEMMKKHGIDNLIDNLKTYMSYYEYGKKLFGSIKTAKTVITDESATENEKIASLYNISKLEVNSPDCGDYANGAYKAIVKAEKKSKKYFEEYLKTGTVHDLEPNILWEKFKNKFNKNTVDCPVNISVINPSGSIVGYVGDDDIWYDDTIYIEENGESKIIYTPIGERYRLEIIGTDTGTVSYTAEQFQDGVSLGHRINAYDIPIVKGSQIEIQSPSDQVSGPQDVSVRAGADSVETVYVDNASSKIDISFRNDSACGNVSGGGTYIVGDMVTLKAEVKEDYVFDGWFDGDELLDWAKEYQFEARSSKTITAKYHKKMTEKEIEEVLIEMGYITPVVKVKSISVTSSASQILAGKQLQLKATVLPADASDKSLTWASSDTKVATVSQTGLVTAVKTAGGKTATITATAKDGSGVKGSYKITVKAETKVSKITVSGISHKIAAGKKVKLTATVLPKNAANKKIKWSSSNTKIATVASDGTVTVKAKTGGKSVKIIAAATDGSGIKTAYSIQSMKGYVKKITLSGESKLKAGKSLKIYATVSATKGANKTLKWTSSNTKYATVSSKGVVKGLKAGKGKKVTITAMAMDGSNKKKTKTIKIK